MKYCTTCNMNLGNVELLEKDNYTYCPKCENEVVEITNKKLDEIIHSVSEAFYQLNESNVRNNAQSLIQNAKVVEQGEKKLKSQMLRKQKQLKELQYELHVIESVATKLNYELEV